MTQPTQTSQLTVSGEDHYLTPMGNDAVYVQRTRILKNTDTPLSTQEELICQLWRELTASLAEREEIERDRNRLDMECNRLRGQLGGAETAARTERAERERLRLELEALKH